jgi:hypothetical protein
MQVKLAHLCSKVDEPMDIDRKVLFKLANLTDDFEFNRPFNQIFPSIDLTPFTIPKCYRLEINSIIYSSFVRNPYTFVITWTSGNFTYVEKVRGQYEGTVVGRPEVTANYYYSCP